MFWRMTIIEQRKIFKRSILWVELGLLALAIGAMSVAIYIAASGSDSMGQDALTALSQLIIWPGALLNSLSIAAGNSVGGMMIIILVGAIAGQEYRWRTLSLWLSQGVSRPTLVAAKLAAVLLPLLLLVLTPLLLAAVLTALFSYQLTGSVPYQQVHWGQLGLSVLRTAFTLLPYASLAFFLAVASRSAMVVIGAGLAFSLVLENIILQLLALLGGIWAKIGQFLPASLANCLMGSNSSLVTVSVNDTVSVPLQMAPNTAALGITLYTSFFIGLSILIFRRQDLSG